MGMGKKNKLIHEDLLLYFTMVFLKLLKIYWADWEFCVASFFFSLMVDFYTTFSSNLLCLYWDVSIEKFGGI